jgi:hypothetical protein
MNSEQLKRVANSRFVAIRRRDEEIAELRAALDSAHAHISDLAAEPSGIRAKLLFVKVAAQLALAAHREGEDEAMESALESIGIALTGIKDE